jgi:hypothetical protein
MQRLRKPTICKCSENFAIDLNTVVKGPRALILKQMVAAKVKYKGKNGASRAKYHGFYIAVKVWNMIWWLESCRIEALDISFSSMISQFTP